MSLRLLAVLLVVLLGCFVALEVFSASAADEPSRAVPLPVKTVGADAQEMGSAPALTSSAKRVREESGRVGGHREAVERPPVFSGLGFDLTRKMRGTIHFPPGTPGGERCELVLRASWQAPASSGRFSRSMDPPMHELVRLLVLDGEEFELPLPDKAERVQLDVDASYVFFDNGGVMLSQEERLRPIELTPRLGGWVTLKLEAPAGFSAPPLGSGFAAAALLGVELQIIEDDGSPDQREHWVRFEEGATAELFAVNPDVPLRVPEGTTLHRNPTDISPFAVPVDWSLMAIAGEHTEAVMQLTESVRYVGIVVDERGHPIPDAMIEAEIGSNGFSWRTTQAGDGNGRFDLRGLPGEPMLMRVQKYGFRTAVIGPSSYGTNMRIVLSDGPRLAGTVRLPDGRPVMGLRLDIRRTDGTDGRPPQVAITDGNGHFEALGMLDATYAIRAAARVGPSSSAKPVDNTSDDPAWHLEVLDVMPAYDGELELRMYAAAPAPE